MACENIPLNEYQPVGKVVLARFVRFNSDTIYGRSGGIQHFRMLSDGQRHSEGGSM